MTKTTKRPRLEIRSAQDNGPTPEREGKASYVDVLPNGKEMRCDGFQSAGAAVRKKPPIDRMLYAGDVNAVQYSDALRWRQEFEKAYAGVVDHPNDFVSHDGTRHDPLTWSILCAASGVWINEVKDAIGWRNDWLLRMVLIGEMSMVSIGEVMFPKYRRSAQADKAAILSICAIERLSEVMCMKRREAAKHRREVPQQSGRATQSENSSVKRHVELA